MVQARHKSVIPARWGGLWDAPRVGPIAVVLSIARGDLVNAESHFDNKLHGTLPGCRRRRAPEAAGCLAADTLTGS